jgi:hypothetical protein
MTAILATDSAPCIIPHVPAFAWGDWTAIQASLRTGVRLDFAQPWFAEPEADFRPGHVWLGVSDEQLVAYSVFEDDQPHNRATAWNEPTWTTGDVIEFFFQAEGRPGYYEFHVTPENQRLQLFFPSSASFHEWRGHRHWAISDSKFESLARIHPERTAWEAVMRIPLALVLDEPREDGSRRFRFSFSRYDYQPGRAKPVTSATTPLSRPDFHHIPQWSWGEAARS